MNGIDLIFLAILLGGLALGFFQGTIKLLVAIIAFITSLSVHFQVHANYTGTAPRVKPRSHQCWMRIHVLILVKYP